MGWLSSSPLCVRATSLMVFLVCLKYLLYSERPLCPNVVMCAIVIGLIIDVMQSRVLWFLLLFFYGLQLLVAIVVPVGNRILTMTTEQKPWSCPVLSA